MIKEKPQLEVMEKILEHRNHNLKLWKKFLKENHNLAL